MSMSSEYEQSIVREWLRGLSLEDWWSAFSDNGYDDLETCKRVGDLDLDAIGISQQQDRDRVLEAVRALREGGGAQVYLSLEECRALSQQAKEEEDDCFDKSSASSDNRSIFSSSRLRSCSSSCINTESREKLVGEGHVKKKGSLAKFLRQMSSTKTSPRHSTVRNGITKSTSQTVRTTEIEDDPPLDYNGDDNTKIVHDNSISAPHSQSVLSDSGRAMSWCSQVTKKKNANYVFLPIADFRFNNFEATNHMDDPPPWYETAHTSPTNHSTSCNSSSTNMLPLGNQKSAICDGECGNIMCGLSPAYIEDSFLECGKEGKMSPCEQRPPREVSECSESLRPRSRSEGCYSAPAYRCKGDRASSPSLDSSRELLSPPITDEVDKLNGESPPSGVPGRVVSSWSVRVRELQREVKNRIGRLRSRTQPPLSPPTRPPVPGTGTNVSSFEVLNSAENISENLENADHDNGGLSSSNRGFVSAGEEDDGNGPKKGPVSSRARAVLDSASTPHQKGPLTCKDVRGETDHQCEKNGHHPFHPAVDSLDDLLDGIGMQEYAKILMTNGYHSPESMNSIDETDLIAIGVLNSNHRRKIIAAVQGCLAFSPSGDAASPLRHQPPANSRPFSPPSRAYSPKRTTDVSCPDAYPINDLDFFHNHAPDSAEDLNIPLPTVVPQELIGKVRGKLYFPHDQHQISQKMQYSYAGQNICAYSEKLYFSRTGLLLDAPSMEENHFRQYIYQVDGTNHFDPLNSSLCYPDSSNYVNTDDKFRMESSRKMIHDQVRSFGNGSLRSQSVDDKSMTLPHQRKLDLTEYREYKQDRSKKEWKDSHRTKKGIPQLLNHQSQGFGVEDFVAQKLQNERINERICAEPYLEKESRLCGMPPALAHRYAKDLHCDIRDVSDAIDAQRMRSLRLRGRPPLCVQNEFLADSSYKSFG